MKKITKSLSADKHIWILIILLSIPAVWALLVPGFYGASDDLHIAWLHQLDKVVREGQIPPRFVPDLSFGFGYPLFNFVFPFPFYIAELFHLAGFSFVDSIKSVFFLSVPLSMAAMYFLLRELSSKVVSLTGAVIYVYAPYRATDLYIRGAIGEIVAFVFLPIITLAVLKVTDEKVNKQTMWRWIGVGGVSLGLLILSHNIIAYMFFPFAALLILMRIILSNQGKRAMLSISSLGMILIGLAISVYFWLPALLESRLMKYDTVFNYWDHFPTLRQLVTPYFGYGASVPGPGDGMSFFMGTANLVLVLLFVVISLIGWKKFNKTQKTVLVWVATMFLSSMFLMNHRSSIFWRNIPLLPYFQFPWRLLTLIVFSTSIFVIALDKLKYKKVISLGILFITIITSFTYFKPQDFLGRKDDYYIDRYTTESGASDNYRETQEEYLRLPINTKKRPDDIFPRAYSDKPAINNISEYSSLNAYLDITTGEEVVINYNKYMLPGWNALLDGRKVEIIPGDPYGQITVRMPAGQHTLEVFYKEPTLKKVLNIVSLSTVILLAILVIKGAKLGKVLKI